MRRLFLCFLLPILLLSGCAAAQTSSRPTENLADLQPRQPLYSMIVPQTDQLAEVSRSEEGVCWEAPDGSCYVVACAAETACDDALTALTGFSPSAIRSVRDSCCGMERSRFSWTTQTGEGTYLCRGQILSDGDWCYCLAVCCREDADGAVRALCTQAFSGFGLYSDEGA